MREPMQPREEHALPLGVHARLARIELGEDLHVIALDLEERELVVEAIEPVRDEFLQEVPDAPALAGRMRDEAREEIDVHPNRDGFRRRPAAFGRRTFRVRMVGHASPSHGKPRVQ